MTNRVSHVFYQTVLLPTSSSDDEGHFIYFKDVEIPHLVKTVYVCWTYCGLVFSV